MPRTLLLADDSVTIQRVIELTFADEDIRVVAVSDGDQAIAVLDRTPPDIVLADVGMPGRNGYEVARHIRDTPSLAHIPVLLLTGAFEPIDQVKADEVRCDGVLAKPFEPQFVIGKVKELLARPKQPLPAPEARTSQPAPDALAAPEAHTPLLAPETLAATEAHTSLAAPEALPASDAQTSLPAPDAQTSFPPPAVVQSQPKTPAPAEVDQYFDRLDQAFANLSSGSPAEPSQGETR